MRELAGLIENLPRESATVRAIVGAGWGWDDKTELLATIAELLAVGNYHRALGHHLQSKDGQPLEPPSPIPRPGAEPVEAEPGPPVMSSPAEVAAALRDLMSDTA